MIELQSSSERRQVEGVTAVLDPEDAEEEAVDEEQQAAPNNDGSLLSLGVGDTRNLQGERDGRKGEDTVWTSLAWAER